MGGSGSIVIIARGFHYGFGILTGYGYRPIRLLVWLFVLWLTCAALYWFTALPPNNVFAPSNPLVFQNEDYAACVPGSRAAMAEQAKPVDAMPAPVKGAGNWYLCEQLRAEYIGFSPLAYSLDVILAAAGNTSRGWCCGRRLCSVGWPVCCWSPSCQA